MICGYLENIYRGNHRVSLRMAHPLPQRRPGIDSWNDRFTSTFLATLPKLGNFFFFLYRSDDIIEKIMIPFFTIE